MDENFIVVSKYPKNAREILYTHVGTYFFLLENEHNIKSYALKILHFHVTS